MNKTMVETGYGAALIARPAEPPEPMARLTAGFAGYYALIFEYLLHRLFDRELAEELTAQTFYKAAANGTRVPGDARQIEFWLIRIATNLANAHYRKGKWYRLLLKRFAKAQPTARAAGEDNDDQDRQRERVRTVLKDLPAKDQTVIVLRYYNRMSSEEMAAILRCRPEAVRARVSRAVNKIRKRLNSVASQELRMS